MSSKVRFIFKFRFSFQDKEGGSLEVSSIPAWPNEFQKFEGFAINVRQQAESFIKKAERMAKEISGE